MTETDLRSVLLLRAMADAGVPGCRSEDGDWAGREARRHLGEPAGVAGSAAAQASDQAWLALRARLALQRLGERSPGLRAWLEVAGGQGSHGPQALAVGFVLALAFGLGAINDPMGGARQINLLALPLLGLLVWNLAVYLALAWAAWRAWRARRAAGSGAGAGTAAASGVDDAGLAGGIGALRQALLGLASALAQRLAPWARRRFIATGSAAERQERSAAARALAAFAQDWAQAGRPLQAARLAALLHAAAALLALGALAGLYARALVLDFHAGWHSTLLGVDGVHRLLSLVLGPAAWLSGQTLPQSTELAALHLAGQHSGAHGEAAARWLHLWALTLLLAVLLPRLLLAVLAERRARRLARKLPLPPQTRSTPPWPALMALMAQARAEGLRPAGAPWSPDRPRRPLCVLPYSYTLDAARQAALAPLLDSLIGPGLQPQWQATLPLGAEDQLPSHLPPVLLRQAGAAADLCADLPAGVALLFAATATPERESHAAVVQALRNLLPASLPLHLLVDESGFRQRFTGLAGERRLAERRQAWQVLLDDAAPGQAPLFIDLGATSAAPAAPAAPGATA